MPDLCRIVDFVPLAWRHVVVATVPLLIGFGAYPLVGIAAPAIGALAAVIGVAFLTKRQSRFFLGAARGILRTQSIDRAYRLRQSPGPREQQRIVNAVNRLADKVEAVLAESRRDRAYLETVLSEVPVGIIVVSDELELQYANGAAREMLDFDFGVDEAMPTMLATKVNLFEINDAIAECGARGGTVVRRFERYETGEHLEIIARRLPVDHDGTGRAVVIVNDRTDEIRLAVSMREFVANASHELRTPIASIQAAVETLTSGADLDARYTAQFHARIDDSVRRMSALVDELMDLTLLETGRSPLNIERVDPAELIDAAMSIHEPAGLVSDGDDARRRLRRDVADGLPLVAVDASKLERALGNLIGNAMKFTPADGRIVVACRAVRDGVCFSVADDGPGIDPVDLPHIFERFYKSRLPVGDPSGFGLGLAIAKNIVEMHGGTLEVDSDVGRGTRFTVMLPIR